MSKTLPEHWFSFLQEPALEQELHRLYQATLAQSRAIGLHFLPQTLQWLRGGMRWKREDIGFFDDKYIPLFPQQGQFLYMQALACGARNMVEFGTSYGISTLYLAAAAKRNGGRVYTTEYLPHKAAAARKHFAAAGMDAYIELYEGDALQTLQQLPVSPDLVLLDGWPDLALPVLRLLEPKLKPGCVILADDTQDFQPAMQPYLDHVRHPDNGYISMPVKPRKVMELSIRR